MSISKRLVSASQKLIQAGKGYLAKYQHYNPSQKSVVLESSVKQSQACYLQTGLGLTEGSITTDSDLAGLSSNGLSILTSAQLVDLKPKKFITLLQHPVCLWQCV